MTMAEMVSEVSFMLGLPANHNVEGLQPEQAINIAFRELKRYMRTPTAKTVPYQRRLDLVRLNIKTDNVLSVFAAYPRMGLTLGTIEAGNVFQVAAAINTQSTIGNTAKLNIDPIMTELAMAQVRNTLATDFQWWWDKPNQVVYCAHRDPKPVSVTIKYRPEYSDVSEVTGDKWMDYLVRMSTANMKIALGRSRSKYRIEGSNVTLDGEVLLSEGNAELEQMRGELEATRNKLTVVN